MRLVKVGNTDMYWHLATLALFANFLRDLNGDWESVVEICVKYGCSKSMLKELTMHKQLHDSSTHLQIGGVDYKESLHIIIQNRKDSI